MKKTTLFTIIFVFLIALTGYVTWKVFGSNFAEVTIDWFAFLAGIYLVIEGIYSIVRYKAPIFPTQLRRATRVIIGTCVFTIHLLQFMRDY